MENEAKFARRHILMGLFGATLPQAIWAASDPCQGFYGQGYCTDYVNSKISPKVRGDGGSWPSNMPGFAVDRGDVAIIRSFNHVAFVESVTKRDAAGNTLEVRISEMNWGRGYRPGTPRECIITSNFGVRTERTISVNSAEFMRPGGYRPSIKPTLTNSPGTTMDMRTAGSTPPIKRK